MENNVNNSNVTTMENTSKFVASVVALLKGDNAEQTAVKIQSQMTLGFDTQLALKKGERADLENTVEQAKTAVSVALANGGKEVRNRPQAIGAYLQAKDALEDAEARLAHLDKEVKWLEEGKAEVNA
jgi:epoxyqueuosine reductase QueG